MLHQEGELQHFFLKLVIPAVRNTFPPHRYQELIVLHYNAAPHRIATDDEILAACNEAPLVKMIFEPTNSPDFNV